MSWDALLRNGRIEQNLEIELLTDVDKYLFIETGMRGGISMVRKRYAKANNPLLPDYDAIMLHKSIAYLAANDLYGWAMSRPLPKKRVHLEAGVAQRRIGLKGGPGVPRRASRGAKQLSTYGAREKSHGSSVEVSLPEKADGRNGLRGPKRREVCPHTAGQKELPGSLTKPAVLSQAGNASGA